MENQTETPFVREDRYLVLKRKDLATLPPTSQNALNDWLDDHFQTLPTREYVVVESDWPEYETVFKMIEARVTGSAALLQSTALPDHSEQHLDMVATPKIGCVQHDCAECQARAALPVGELTLPSKRDIGEFDPKKSGSTFFRGLGWNEAIDEVAGLLAAARPQPVLEPLPLMSEAFRTTVAHGPSEDYRMVFKFKDLDSLHAADDEWRKFRSNL